MWTYLLPSVLSISLIRCETTDISGACNIRILLFSRKIYVVWGESRYYGREASMSEQGGNKCSECGGEMIKGGYVWGYGLVPIRFLKSGDRHGDEIIPFYCKNCGFIKLYKKMK
jgi:hypothetical protein